MNITDYTGTLFFPHDPDELGITDEKIRSFAKLKKGWDLGKGVCIDQDIIDQTLYFCHLAKLRGLFKTDAFPDPNGGIMVTIYQGNDYLEFSFQPDQTVIFVHEENKIELRYEPDLDFKDAIEKINNYGKSLWSSLELSTPCFTTSTKKDLRANLFSPAMTAAYP